MTAPAQKCVTELSDADDLEDIPDDDEVADVAITPALVATLNPDAAPGAHMLQLSWAKIGRIENLCTYTALKTLYLQYNRISKIEGLGALTALEFLALQHNAISHVENLGHMKGLQFLDLSHNQIHDVDVDALPASLAILNLRNNPSKDHGPYCQMSLPRLELLDGVELSHGMQINGIEAPAPDPPPARAVAEERVAEGAGDTQSDQDAFIESYLLRNSRHEKLSKQIAHSVHDFDTKGGAGLGPKVQELTERSVQRRAVDKNEDPDGALDKARGRLRDSKSATMTSLKDELRKSMNDTLGEAIRAANAARQEADRLKAAADRQRVEADPLARLDD